MTAMLEGAPLQPSSSAHRWRQLHALTTSDGLSGPDRLAVAAALLCAATDAAACEIHFDAPSGRHRANFGPVPTNLADRHAASRSVLPYGQPQATLHDYAAPLVVNGQRRGSLQLYDVGEALLVQELEAAAAMIASALQQCTAWPRPARGHRLGGRPHRTRHRGARSHPGATQAERDSLLQHEIEVRKQVGRDLHDGPVQQVAVATLMVQYVRRVAELAPEGLSDALNDLEQQLKRANRDLRTVLYELRPLGIVEDGLAPALAQYVARLQEGSGSHIHFEGPSELPRLAPSYENGVFLIVQEALNNVRKHAQATEVTVRVAALDDFVTVEVRDNGRGFQLSEVEASYWQRGSYGLLNMRERAALFGGTCDIESRPGSGTVVLIRAPLPV